jgi:arabinofuranan 3-O-arabinosyltransferase
MRSIAAPRLSRPDPGSAFMAAVTGIVFGYAAVLLVFLLQQNWILTSGGIPMPSDYLAYRAAGIAALRGNAASVYDPHSFHLLQVYLSKPFPNYFYWNYPPPFFFVTASLAMLPYVAAFLLWLGATAAAFAVAVGRIAGRPKVVMAVFASPVVFLTAYVGQNGFLSAALIGAFLLCLRERPTIAGILLALMTYKPQLGILFPLVLLAGCHWRTLCSASVAAAIITGASIVAFGLDSYALFFRSLSLVSGSYLTLGGEGWAKIESMYSVARYLGAGDHAAWIVQILTSTGCALGVAWLWRSNTAYELKAAGVVVATMLSIPYLHEYDFPLILIACVFLYRQRVFDRAEWFAVGAVNLLMAGFFAEIAPLGVAVVLIVGAMVLRRAAFFAPEPGYSYKAAHS